jgi:hypothetical protein
MVRRKQITVLGEQNNFSIVLKLRGLNRGYGLVNERPSSGRPLNDDVGAVRACMNNSNVCRTKMKNICCCSSLAATEVA